ncbi:PPR repeat family protein [Sarocladium implicatum]|nr:PPR repeat family protein [Sarocladium implicatum]
MLATRPVCTRCASRLSLSQLATAASSSPSRQRLLASSYSTATAPEPPKRPRRGPKPRDRTRSSNGSETSSQEALDHAVALFNEVVNPTRRDAKTPTEPGSQPVQSVAEWEVAGKLKVMEEKQAQYGPAERLYAFRTQIMPYFDTLDGPSPKHIFTSASNYLAQIASEVSRKGLVGFSVGISDMLASIGNWDLTIRNHLILNLCYILVSAKDRKTAQEAPLALIELIDMWKHLSQLGRDSQLGQPLAFTFPTTEELEDRLGELMRRKKKRYSPEAQGIKVISTAQLRIAKALALPFRPSLLRSAEKLVPGLLTSVVLLWDRRIVGARVPPEAEPLLKAAATILHRIEIQPDDVAGILNSPSRIPIDRLRRLRFYVMGQWSQVLEALLSSDQTWGDTILPTASRSGGSYLAHVHKKLRAAHQTRNLKAVKTLWEELKQKLEQSPELAFQLRKDTDFMDFWIYVWCVLGQDLYLQEMVGIMNTVGVEPTLKSYTAMMHGWKKSSRDASNLTKIDTLWNTLRRAEMKLDTYIWVERVSAYVEYGKTQQAIDALGEMMGLWKEAVSHGKEDEAVKPTIEVVNAVLKSLLRHEKPAARTVLSWASKEGILPDVFTYNILIRECFRSNDRAGVPSLLSDMKEQGVDLDTSSFTIILEECIGSMGHASAPDQVQAVLQVCNDMDSAGFPPNQAIYGKMLHAVSILRDGGSDEAIEAVLDRARQRGFLITPHMITILIERQLSRDSGPDMTAIEAILANYNIRNVLHDGDQKLWERVLTGYAITGDPLAAMRIYRQLRDSGRSVTALACLNDLLKGLLDAGEKTQAKEVVKMTLENKAGGDERYWRHHFWFQAEARGLLQGLDLPQELTDRLGRQ